MATYAELTSIVGAGTLRDRLTAAVAVQAEVVRTESGATTNHANRLLWAKAALGDPQGWANKMIWAVMAQNVAATKAQIEGATDAQLLTAVANTVDIFATGA